MEGGKQGSKNSRFVNPTGKATEGPSDGRRSNKQYASEWCRDGIKRTPLNLMVFRCGFWSVLQSLDLTVVFPGKVSSASWSNIIYDIQMEEMFSSDSSCMEFDMSVLAILGSGLLWFGPRTHVPVGLKGHQTNREADAYWRRQVAEWDDLISPSVILDLSNYVGILEVSEQQDFFQSFVPYKHVA